MVVRVVGDVAGDVLLLQAADAVLEALRARARPGAGQGLEVAAVGQERLVLGVRGAVAKPRVDRGSSAASGSRQGSAPLAR